MTAPNLIASLDIPRQSAAHPTNTKVGSVAQAQHSAPVCTLYGRIAASPLGRLGKPFPDLHLSLIIDDAYSGIVVIDGQPTMNEVGIKNALLIRTNTYENALPKGAVFQLSLSPPDKMSKQVFAQELVMRSLHFSSYVATYSFPEKVRGAKMNPGEYNSGSYLAGLLQSVMGYVPAISTPGYQTPGWENPMPRSFFKGEAMR
ncbi:MAG: hypothetical protein JWQ73_159 [Variovorax sp.]|nr:hypothetical protein [Variovorax sp.]